MVSVRARAFIAAARLQRKKSFYATAAGMRRRLSAHQSAARCEPPRSVRRHRRITRHEVQGHSCYTLHPDGRWDGLHIFHLHGGGFVEQPEKHHWRFADNLVGALGCRYSMFMYPLAPEHDHREITAVTRRAYREMMADTPQSGRVLFGDSAGGSLSLGIAQELRDRGEAQPACIALFSPWLNMAVDHELSQVIEPHDPELGLAGLQQAGRWYAADRPLDDPELSPEHANLAGIAALSIFIGTRDILLPDALLLHFNACTVGTTSRLQIYDGMFHNWAMKPIPEAHRARRQLIEFLAESTRAAALSEKEQTHHDRSDNRGDHRNRPTARHRELDVEADHSRG